MQNGFLKGMGMGLVAGAMMTAVIIPMDKRKLMRSNAGRTVKAISQVMGKLSDAFL